MNKAQRKITQRLTGLWLIALILLLGMAGANPDLHWALHADSPCPSSCEPHPHKDSEDAGHTCAVTLLQTGTLFQVDLPSFDTLGSVRDILERFDEKPFTVVSFCLPQGRAPPIVEIV